MRTLASPPAAAPATSAAPDALAAGRLGMDELKELMSAVHETTERLERTHVALREEVARLQGELQEANAQLRRSRQLAALGEMAAGIAHEIRNPLGSIRLYAQALGEDVAGEPEPARLCAKIGHAVTTLDAIVRDVLMFARDMRVDPVLAPAAAIVDDALRHAEGLVGAAAVEVVRDVPAGPEGEVRADPALMVQAVGNVVRNAVEAMIEAGSSPRRLGISVRRRHARRPDGRRGLCSVIAVDDTGPGIPPEVIERMFNPFFTTRKTGTGLGLAIVHRIVDAHGGHVGVHRAEGGGARVELCLPVAPPDPQPSTGHQHEQGSDR